jgi:hypothetical protein
MKGRQLYIIGAAIGVCVLIYVLLTFMKREGFEDPFINLSEEDQKFIIDILFVPVGLRIITDRDSMATKTAEAYQNIGVGAVTGGKIAIAPDQYNSVRKSMLKKVNEREDTALAYKIYKTVKFPNPFDKKYKPLDDDSEAVKEAKGKKITEAFKAAALNYLQKLKKAMPSYPFSKDALDVLNAPSDKDPTKEQCTAVYRCVSAQSIPEVD